MEQGQGPIALLGMCCPAACQHQRFPTAQPFCTSPADTTAFILSVFLSLLIAAWGRAGGEQISAGVSEEQETQRALLEYKPEEAKAKK